MWGAGGQAGFNTSGNVGGSGAAGVYVKTYLQSLELNDNIYVCVGQGGGRGQRSYYDGGDVNNPNGRYFSGGWGGYGGHKQANPSGEGGAGGGASLISQTNDAGTAQVIIASAGGGGGGGGASRNYSGGDGNVETGSLWSEPGPGYNGAEMIGFGGGGGGGGGGPQRGARGKNGPENISRATGGKSGGHILFASGGGEVHTPLTRAPYIDSDVPKKNMGTGGLTNGEHGTDGYVEIEFEYGAGASYIKRRLSKPEPPYVYDTWREVVDTFVKSPFTGEWSRVYASYIKQGDDWVIVNRPINPFIPITVVTQGLTDPDTGSFVTLFGRAEERPKQYVDPPPPPPPPPPPLPPPSPPVDHEYYDSPDNNSYNSDQGQDDGGGGGGGGGASIICTELFRRGMMPADIYAADTQYGSKLFDSFPEMKTGYHRWARIVTEWMNGRGPTFMWWIRDPEERAQRQSAWATKWVEELAAPWAAEMAHIQGVRKNSSRAGRWLMKLGYPITKYIGKMKTEPKYVHLLALVAILAIIAKTVVLISGEKINLKGKNNDSE